ncbi:hypothetical protein ACFC8N_18065 [Streptomyces sp. NPDC055966]|uniref:hypothetical protein n=1 Tax=Streptomyces sp. NPDC055966 TaxID=3345669 RepID=UPI0035D70BBB
MTSAFTVPMFGDDDAPPTGRLIGKVPPPTNTRPRRHATELVGNINAANPPATWAS